MSQMNALLNQRLKKNEPSSKMAVMAKQSANGLLTSFSGVFNVAELSLKEKEGIQNILQTFAAPSEDIQRDLDQLLSITSEVKAIHNQAAILHGERIKKAHSILTRYRDGAFTAWLIAIYGNRQTPYNFMQYYDFYETIPKSLRTQLESMPRQAIYALASREGPIEKKRDIIENYKGEGKSELLLRIRETFPLNSSDKRRENVGEKAIQTLTRLQNEIARTSKEFTKTQRVTLQKILENIRELVNT